MACVYNGDERVQYLIGYIVVSHVFEYLRHTFDLHAHVVATRPNFNRSLQKRLACCLKAYFGLVYRTRRGSLRWERRATFSMPMLSGNCVMQQSAPIPNASPHVARHATTIQCGTSSVAMKASTPLWWPRHRLVVIYTEVIIHVCSPYSAHRAVSPHLREILPAADFCSHVVPLVPRGTYRMSTTEATCCLDCFGA